MMKQLVLKWDTALTASSLAYAITATCNSVVCEIENEKTSDFTTAEYTLYQTSVARYSVIVSVSQTYVGDDANYVNVQKFLAAPVRRVQLITTSSVTGLNGYTAFNSDNAINFNVVDSQTQWQSNKRLRNVTFRLVSESKYNIS